MFALNVTAMLLLSPQCRQGTLKCLALCDLLLFYKGAYAGVLFRAIYYSPRFTTDSLLRESNRHIQTEQNGKTRSPGVKW